MDKKKISTLLSNIIAEDAVKAAADGYMGLPNPLKGSSAGRGAKRATGRLPVREAWREAERCMRCYRIISVITRDRIPGVTA